MDKNTIDKIKSLIEEKERYESALDRINTKDVGITVEYYIIGHGFINLSICKNEKDKEELVGIVKSFINEKLEKINNSLGRL